MIRNTGNVEGIGEQACHARTDRTTVEMISLRSRSSAGTGSPSTKRVTKHPAWGRNATTGGPTPAEAAARAATCSADRSIPSSSVPEPKTRTTTRPPPQSRRKFRFVMPAVRTETRTSSAESHPGTAAIAGCNAGSSEPMPVWCGAISPSFEVPPQLPVGDAQVVEDRLLLDRGVEQMLEHEFAEHVP